MTVEWGDLAWFVVPVLLQATEHAAATAHLVAQRTALISTQSVIQQPQQYVPFMKRADVFGRILYYIALPINKVIKVMAFATKTIYLKVFGDA